MYRENWQITEITSDICASAPPVLTVAAITLWQRHTVSCPLRDPSISTACQNTGPPHRLNTQAALIDSPRVATAAQLSPVLFLTLSVVFVQVVAGSGLGSRRLMMLQLFNQPVFSTNEVDGGKHGHEGMFTGNFKPFIRS